MQSNWRLIVFVKAPCPGTVKTRLALSLGADAACDAYRRLVEVVLDRIKTVRSVYLRYAPDDGRPLIQPWLRDGWSASPQGDGDLGVRLARAFAEAFRSGAERVVVIGSDCPWMEVADIEESWRAMEDHDAVIGPASDGGYWLLGLRRSTPELFSGIEWSTASVFKETMDRASCLGMRVCVLRELRDVDSLDDWQAFVEDNSFARADTPWVKS